MKIISPSFRFIDQGDGFNGILKQIEKAGRVAYKSENMITDTSAEVFVGKLIKLGHMSPLEFGTVYLRISAQNNDKIITKYSANPYSWVMDSHNGSDVIIITNYRVIKENQWDADLEYLIDPIHDLKNDRICVKLICDRGIMSELTRHRKFSFLIESTRFNNYSLHKYGSECTFIRPIWLNNINENIWKQAMESCEKNYFQLLAGGCTPQEARSVLPNSLKTEIYMCGFINDWMRFFDLRCDSRAHPQMRELTIPLRDAMKQRIGI